MDITNNLQTMLFTTMHMNLINNKSSNFHYLYNMMCLFAISLFLNSIKNSFNKYMNDFWIDSNIFRNNYIFKKIYSFIGTKNQIEYSGKIATLSNQYDKDISITHNFSDSFKAVWYYLNKSIESNGSIYKIKEVYSNSKNIYNKDSFYIVSQRESFIIDKQLEIYAYTNIKNEDISDDKQKNKNSVEQIIIVLYSYKSSLSDIKNFVKGITDNYNNSISDLRQNKKFIYEVIKTKFEENRCECWSETVFSSNRTFQNLFFNTKKEVLNKINFFLNNKDWYNEKGIPYTLGIGLHGPPGTGKTSFIKALANETGRHIVSFSFKIVKTKKDLNSIFFEDRYNEDNKKGAIGFDKKIIAFEDIDCIGDIILKRNNEIKTKTKQKQKQNPKVLNNNGNISSIIEKLVNIESEGQKELIKMNPNLNQEEPITLDDILNLWDGIRETPGRIIIMSSNHYNKLDAALTRPGRIDITLELTNASRETINEIYYHYFKIHIPSKQLNKIKDYFYSPAEVFNIYMECNFNQEKMINRLIQNKHIL